MNRESLMHLQHDYNISTEWNMLKLLNLSMWIKGAPLNSQSFSNICTLPYLEHFKALVTLKEKGKTDQLCAEEISTPCKYQ